MWIRRTDFRLLRLPDFEMLPRTCEPLPHLGEEIYKVAEVCLTGGGINDSLDRYAEERESEDENEYPEDEMQEV